MYLKKPHSARAEGSDDAQVPAAITDRFREFEAVVENLDEMIAAVDRDYRYLMANRAFLNYRRMERENIVGHLILETLSHEAFEEVIKGKLDECFQGKAVNYEMKYRYPHLGERDLLISYFPIEDSNGSRKAACVLRDITERRLAERALHEAQTNLAH